MEGGGLFSLVGKIMPILAPSETEEQLVDRHGDHSINAISFPSSFAPRMASGRANFENYFPSVRFISVGQFRRKFAKIKRFFLFQNEAKCR